MKLVSDIYYCDTHDDSHLLDIFLPDTDNFPVLIYLHGGGLENGNKGEATSLYHYLADNGIAVVSVNYRLYPDAKYPEHIEDCAQAVSWAFKNMSSYGNCDKFYICGTSAGAYISMMLCFNKKYFEPYGISPTDISGYIHNGGQPTSHFNVLRERGEDTRRLIVDESAPLYYIGTSENLSPMLFVAAENDMACRYEQLALTVKTLEHFEYDTDKIEFKILPGTHCNYIYLEPEDTEFVFGNEILHFINKY